MAKKADAGLDILLALNGDRYFVDEKGELEAVFKVARVAEIPQRPYGIKYSLVLLDAKGDRVVGFDNAHAVSQGSGPGKKRSAHYDHKHVGKRTTPYTFKDAHTLVKDFWTEVDKKIKEKQEQTKARPKRRARRRSKGE
ncbi:MAG: toxin-antitoxin system TumE family protein [Gammaproteobacteria bacterium]